MVLRFLFLILLFIFACADFERDNVYDTEGDNPTYELCGNSDDGNRFHLETQFCYNNAVVSFLCDGKKYDLSKERCENDVIETKCGINGWYDASDENLRCKSNYRVETACGDDWYDASDKSLRCEDDVVETACGSDWYDASDKSLRCEDDVVETACGSDYWYDASDKSLRCEDDIVEVKCGRDWFSAETYFCYDDKVEERCGGRSEAFDTDLYECRDENKIYLKETVSHGGKDYEAVLIGAHTWLTENLDYEVEDGICYEDVDSNCDTHGRLYNWAAAMDDICPEGWHLPDYDELSTLNKSKEIDAHGFAAISGGFGFPGGSLFDGIDEYGGWWSSTQENESSVYYLHYDGNSVYLGIGNENVFLSVRCVMD